MYFEICVDDANIKRLLGKDRANLSAADATPTKDGRTDAVFGSTYVYLPSTTLVQSITPTSHMRATTDQTLDDALWVINPRFPPDLKVEQLCSHGSMLYWGETT